MKRAKAERWKETHRREVGVDVGSAPHAGATFAIAYMVDECREELGRAIEWRQRLVFGRTLYQATPGCPAVAALLGMVASGVRTLRHIAIAAEDATSRRMAR